MWALVMIDDSCLLVLWSLSLGLTKVVLRVLVPFELNLYVFAFTYPFESVCCFRYVRNNYGGLVFVVVVLVVAGVVGIVVVVGSVTGVFETVFPLV